MVRGSLQTTLEEPAEVLEMVVEAEVGWVED